MASTILERFWSKVELIPFTTCWIWTGTITGYHRDCKYGCFNIGRGNMLTHRFSWELHNAQEIPTGMHVLHRCDVPYCINPAHLFLGTHIDNMRDMKLKGRARGAEGVLNVKCKLTGEEVEFIRNARTLGETCVSLASKFNVVPSTISRISGKRGWLKRA